MDAAWAWVAGMAVGGGLGTLFGQWMQLLLWRNPLRQLARAYRELWRDIVYLCATGNLRPGRLDINESPGGRDSAGAFCRL
jgi:O-antigen/teichoic acid export membrane protein